MTASRRAPPPFASDDWMFEQQVRAELEAEAWRRLRTQLAGPPEPPPPPPPLPTIAASQPSRRLHDPHHSGSAMLKGLVRFVIAAIGSYLTYVAGLDSQM